MSNPDSDRVPKFKSKSIADTFTSFWKTIAWTIIILILSFLPGQALKKLKLLDIRFQDLIVHFIIYAVLTVFIIWEKSRKSKQYMKTKTWWLLPLLATVILGLITETVQWLWITGRYGSIIDYLLNMSGCVVVILLYRIAKPRFI